MSEKERESQLLIAEQLYKQYKGAPNYCLKNIHISVSEGEIATMIGPSGSGKTTLINLLAGLDKPDRGTIRYGTLNLGAMDDRELTDWRRRYCGIVFQNFALLETLTALENVEIPLINMKYPFKKRREKARNLLHFMGLDKRRNHLIHQLSGGERQRIGIARALVTDPALVFADEPGAAQNLENKEKILRLFDEYRLNSGTSFIIVSHDQLFSSFSDRIITLDNGEIRYEETALCSD